MNTDLVVVIQVQVHRPVLSVFICVHLWFLPVFLRVLCISVIFFAVDIAPFIPRHHRRAFLQVEGQDDVVADPGACLRRKAPRPQARPSLVASVPIARPSAARNWKRPRTTFFSAAGTVITA